jgi:hypothetical protein
MEVPCNAHRNTEEEALICGWPSASHRLFCNVLQNTFPTMQSGDAADVTLLCWYSTGKARGTLIGWRMNATNRVRREMFVFSLQIKGVERRIPLGKTQGIK